MAKHHQFPGGLFGLKARIIAAICVVIAIVGFYGLRTYSRGRAEEQLRTELTQFVRTEVKTQLSKPFSYESADFRRRVAPVVKLDDAIVEGKYANNVTLSLDSAFSQLPVEDRAYLLQLIADQFNAHRWSLMERLTAYADAEDGDSDSNAWGVTLTANGERLVYINRGNYVFYDQQQKKHDEQALRTVRVDKEYKAKPAASSSTPSTVNAPSTAPSTAPSSNDKKAIDTAIALLAFCAGNPECQTPAYRQLDIDGDGRITQNDLNAFKKSVGR